ncbi:hypothetical protein C8R47DRAFT_1129690 [Mycena vitilis]|nr:hypothetical protein C8R47DRAFT_1129690 [Mycena vitilis]
MANLLQSHLPVLKDLKTAAELPISGKVTIYHPGYTSPPLLLLDLVVYQSPSGPDGILLGFVLDACLVIANHEPGFLCAYGSTSTRVPDADRNVLLRPGEYQYYTGTLMYPICTGFDNWCPPEVLPLHWSDVRLAGTFEDTEVTVNDSSWTVISQAIKTRDPGCVITGERSRINSSHLVPSSARDWYNLHRLHTPAGDLYTHVNSPNNVITLRADLNALAFNQGQFFLIPFNSEMISIMVTMAVPDLAYEYHFRRAAVPARIRRLYLYCRFAWNVFKIMPQALSEAIKQKKVVTVPVTDDSLNTPSEKRKSAAVPPSEEQTEAKALRLGGSGTSNRSTREGPESPGESSVDTPLDSPQPLDLYQYDDEDIAILEEIDKRLRARGKPTFVPRTANDTPWQSPSSPPPMKIRKGGIRDSLDP